MYLATFDDQGKRIASYVVGLHTDIPAEAVAISDEDQALYVSGNYHRGKDGKPVEIPAYVPTPDEIKDQELSALDAEYQPQFDELSLAWATASMDGNAALAASIKADKATLQNEYQQKREAIING